MMSNKADKRNIEDILASDDELPDDYIDEIQVPAYKIDERFTELNFQWLTGKAVRKFHESVIQEMEEDLYQKMSLLNNSEKAFIDKGILKKQDLLCLQHVASVVNDATVVWFLNFLKYKDLHSRFGFLKSCLVTVNERNHSYTLDLGKKNLEFIINIKV